MRNTPVQVVYKELAHHAFVHVLTLTSDNHLWSIPGRALGKLRIIDNEEFIPRSWTFVYPKHDLQDGVYPETQVKGRNLKLFPN